MFRPIFLTLAALALSALIGPMDAEAQQPTPPSPSLAACDPRPHGAPLFNGFFIHEENDSLPLAGGDKNYTQGLRVSATHNPAAHPCWVQRAGRWRLPGGNGDPFFQTLSYILGQGLYTPRLITMPTPQPGDRGFADFNYVGASLSLTASDETLRYTAEASVGALGNSGLARGAQGGLHALKLHRIPKGWDTTSPNGFGVYTRLQVEKKWGVDLPNPFPSADLVVGPAVELGNVRTAAAGHATIRVGWGLSGFGPTTIPPGANRVLRSTLEVGALLGYEGRAIAHTSLVSATPGTADFDRSRGVLDRRVGGFFRWDDLRVSYLRVDRSAEFSVAGNKRKHRFGSVAIGFEPSGMINQTLRHWLLADWSAELGMGRNFDGPVLDSGTPGGITAQFGVRRGIWKGLFVGAEFMVVTAEALATQRAPSIRPDVILRQQLLTAGWGRDFKFGYVGLRGGTALKTSARVETMLYAFKDGQLEEDPWDDDYAAGSGGWMWGFDYLPPLERRMAIGIDISRHSVKVDEPMPGLVKPRYWKANVLIRVRRAPTK